MIGKARSFPIETGGLSSCFGPLHQSVFALLDRRSQGDQIDALVAITIVHAASGRISRRVLDPDEEVGDELADGGGSIKEEKTCRNSYGSPRTMKWIGIRSGKSSSETVA
jgi:hypothetical protein